MHTKLAGFICTKHGLEYHFYADDTQLYLTLKPTDKLARADTAHRIETCIQDIISCMDARKYA